MAAIDLRPYGLDWTLDPAKMSGPIPARYTIATVNYTAANRLSFSLPSWGAPKTFNLVRDLKKRGSFGSTWLTDAKIDAGVDVIAKIIPFGAHGPTDNAVMLESIIQIIIAKETVSKSVPEINLVGPFCPRLYLLGKSSDAYFLIMEKMDDTLKDSLFSRHDSPSLMQYYFCQIAKIAEILSDTLEFNHRDFKTDNIMYTRANGHRQIRYIDFGFSCLNYHGMKIITPNHYVKHCNLPSRDMNSLLYYYFIVDYSIEPPRESQLKNIAKILLSYYPSRPAEWLNTYTFYNTQATNPNTHPTALYNLFKNLIFATDYRTTSVDPNWTQYLVEINDNMIARMNDVEMLNISGPVLINYVLRGSKANIIRIYNAAIRAGKRNIINLLIQSSSSALLSSDRVKINGAALLKEAIKQNDKELIIKLLNVPTISLDISESSEPTLLFTLAKQANLDPYITHILFKLLSKSVAVENDLGQTAPMLAAAATNLEFINAWLSIPKRLTSQRDHKGDTVLHYAARFVKRSSTDLANQNKIVSMLIDANPALMYIRNRQGWGFGQRANSKAVAGLTQIRTNIKTRRAAQNKRKPVINTNKQHFITNGTRK